MVERVLEARYTQDEIVRKYNWIAPVYDLFGLLVESKARRRALEMIDIRGGENILEVALGTGLNFVEMLRRNPNGWVFGIDISPKMLKKAQKRIAKTGRKNYTLRLCDCRHLPFEENTFDIVVNEYLLDILPSSDFIPILSEFKRVLKQGGKMVLVNMTKGERRVHQFYEEIYKLKPPLLAGCRGVIVQPLLEQIGVRVLKREFVSKFGFPSEIVVGLKRDGISEK